MNITRTAVLLGLALATVAVEACSSSHGPAGSPTGSIDGLGQVGATKGAQAANEGKVQMNWTVAPGIDLTSVSYQINGPNRFSGNITIGDAQSLEFVVGGIPAGNGYTLTLSASDSVGDPCTGTSGAFNVAAGQTTGVGLTLVCTQTSDASFAADVTTGSIGVDAGVIVVDGGGSVTCPGISSLSISPSEVLVGQPAALSLSTIGAANPSIAWTVSPSTGASIANPTAASTAFTCTSGGVYTVTANVGLAGTSACNGLPFTTMSETIDCEGAQAQSDAGGGSDAGSGTDGGSGGGTASACTTAPCAAGGANSVRCDGNTNGVCTATEAVVVNQDIALGNVSGTTLNPSTSCYECLLTAGCLDDQTFGDTGHECQDVSGSATTGTGAGITFTQLCLNTLQCVVGSGCQSSATEGISACYCGSNETNLSSCASASDQNGSCLSQELAGLNLASGASGTTVLTDFTNTAQFGSAMANQIFVCAGTGSQCSAQCLASTF